MKEVTSVLEFANAAAIERINYELVKVIENIQNPNTDEKPHSSQSRRGRNRHAQGQSPVHTPLSGGRVRH